MNSKEAYKHKMEAELGLAQAKLEELKARAKRSSASVESGYAKQFDELEGGVNATKAKLKDLAEASDDVWERMKHRVEHAWGTVSNSVKDVATKLRE